MLEDLQCDEFRELGLAEIKEKKESLVASTAAREIVILHNLLLCDEIAPQLVPMLEAGGVLEVIKLFLKSRYTFKYLLLKLL